MTCYALKGPGIETRWAG